jgi:hypothetical protein
MIPDIECSRRALLGALLVVACGQSLSAQSPTAAISREELSGLVGSEIIAERATVGDVLPWRPSDFDVKVLPLGSALSASVSCVTVNGFFHNHAYVIGKVSGRLYRLGGFTAPEVVPFSTSLDQSMGGPSAPLPRIGLLLGLLEPEGCARFESVTALALATWSAPANEVRDRLDIPHDSIQWISSVGTLATKVVERSVLGTAPGISCVVYSFLFDSGQRITSWSRRDCSSSTEDQ